MYPGGDQATNIVTAMLRKRGLEMTMLTGEGVFVLCFLPLVGGVLFALGIMVLTDVEPPRRNVAPKVCGAVYRGT